MCIVWSGGLLGDQLVASANSGCLCQLKIQSSLLLHTINSAHTVDGLPIIVTRTALKGAGISDVKLVLWKLFPTAAASLCRPAALCTCHNKKVPALILGFFPILKAWLKTLQGYGWVVCVWWRIGDLSRVCSCPSPCDCWDWLQQPQWAWFGMSSG